MPQVLARHFGPQAPRWRAPFPYDREEHCRGKKDKYQSPGTHL
jgi:hypothetical protein